MSGKQSEAVGLGQGDIHCTVYSAYPLVREDRSGQVALLRNGIRSSPFTVQRKILRLLWKLCFLTLPLQLSLWTPPRYPPLFSQQPETSSIDETEAGLTFFYPRFAGVVCTQHLTHAGAVDTVDTVRTAGAVVQSTSHITLFGAVLKQGGGLKACVAGRTSLGHILLHFNLCFHRVAVLVELVRACRRLRRLFRAFLRRRDKRHTNVRQAHTPKAVTYHD